MVRIFISVKLLDLEPCPAYDVEILNSIAFYDDIDVVKTTISTF